MKRFEAPSCGRSGGSHLYVRCLVVLLATMGSSRPAAAQANVPPTGPVETEAPRLRDPEVAIPASLPSAPTRDQAPRADANFVHFEVLGNAGLYSLNYTRLLPQDFSARAGISYVALGASISRTSGRADALTVPILVQYLGVARGPHKLELGLGPLLAYGSARARLDAREAIRARFRVLATATIGYRYLAPTGFTFNVSFTPVVGPLFLPWGGLGIGHTF